MTRDEWLLANRKDWMSEDQWECWIFLSDLFGGFHHICGRLHEWGTGIKLNCTQSNWAATYDFNGLTRAVFMAHDRCIRFAIEPSGPGMMGLIVHKRHKRAEGRMYERHPTIEQALKSWRENNPKPTKRVRKSKKINEISPEEFNLKAEKARIKPYFPLQARK